MSRACLASQDVPVSLSKAFVPALILIALLGSSGLAQTSGPTAYWKGGTTGSWFDANNWVCTPPSGGVPCVPNAGTDAVVFNGAVSAVGGSPSAGNLLLNNNGSSLIVEGGATGTSGTIVVGSSCLVPCGASTFNLLETGTTWANTGDISVGGEDGAELNVNDSASLTTSGQLVVGDEAPGILTIEGGGVVKDNRGQIQFTYSSFSTSVVQVFGSGSSWINATMLDVGGAGSADLAVQAGGIVSAETITINELGFVNAKGGTLQGTVINHGTLDPLGVATINGDYTQGVDGTLILDVSGTGAGEFGQLDVSRNATFDGTIELDFIDGFAPSKGGFLRFYQRRRQRGFLRRDHRYHRPPAEL